jgi:glycosyltransferase involved in cell wall biosynthesis
VKVLVVSQYFPPEPGGSQNRLGTFATALADRGHEVTVVCEQPCHPVGVFQEGYGHRPVVVERDRGITFRRLWVATSPIKTTRRRLAFYGTFAVGAGAAVLAAPRHDVVFASSPPLPGILAAAQAATIRRLPLVVDVRDLWPAAAEALGELREGRVLRAFEHAERRLYRQARTVTATTRPFCRHIEGLAEGVTCVHLPNGALDELVALPDSEPPAASPFVIGYAGNFGIAQGLEIALDAAERLRDEDVRFVLLGDGPRAGELREGVAARGLGNVELRPGVPVAEVAGFLQSCHALLVPLRDHPLLDDFIPSKLYDAMAVGRPALVAARGEAAALAAETGGGLVVPPEDGEALAAAIRRLASKPELRDALSASGRHAAAGLARSRQVEKLEDVLRAAAGGDRVPA